MPDLGKILFSFPDARAPKWALFILGLALLAAGGLLVLVFAVEQTPEPIDEDAIGAGVLLGGLLLGGAASAFFGLRDLVGRPEWHVTASHAYRTRGTKVIRSIALAEQPTPQLTAFQRYGHVVSVRVQLGRSAIMMPSMEAAQTVVNAWRTAKSR